MDWHEFQLKKSNMEKNADHIERLFEKKQLSSCTIPSFNNLYECYLSAEVIDEVKKSGINLKIQNKTTNRIFYDTAETNVQISLSVSGENNIIILEGGCNLRHNSVISIEGSNHIIIIKKGSGASSLNITMRGNNGLFYYGENCTSNGTDCLVHGDVAICIGDDSMFAVNSVLRTYDSHAIISLDTAEQLNRSKSIIIHNHVWLGQNTIIMPGVEVGSGSIVGAGSIVTKNVEKNFLVAGVPAQMLKTGVTWTRDAFPSKQEIAHVINNLTK